MSWSGQLTEEGADATGIVGEFAISKDSAFDACGGIKCWNILGAYRQVGGFDPGDERIRMDYLTDGSIFEKDFHEDRLWSPGARVQTDFGGAAESALPNSSRLGSGRVDVNQRARVRTVKPGHP